MSLKIEVNFNTGISIQSTSLVVYITLKYRFSDYLFIIHLTRSLARLYLWASTKELLHCSTWIFPQLLKIHKPTYEVGFLIDTLVENVCIEYSIEDIFIYSNTRSTISWPMAANAIFLEAKYRVLDTAVW